MKKWIDTTPYGTLSIEMDLITFQTPLLFVCRTNRHEKFLALCVDEIQHIYTIVRTSTAAIIDMLQHTCSVAEAFREYVDGEVLIVWLNEDGSLMEEELRHLETLSEEMLPYDGEYIEEMNETLKAYLERLIAEE